MFKIMTVLLLLILSTPAHAFNDDWTKKDIQMEALSLALIAVDTFQTASWVEDPESPWVEGNVILGKHPTKKELYIYNGVAMITHVLIADYLSPKWRTKFQYGTIALEAGIVIRSHSLGTRIEINF